MLTSKKTSELEIAQAGEFGIVQLRMQCPLQAFHASEMTQQTSIGVKSMHRAFHARGIQNASIFYSFASTQRRSEAVGGEGRVASGAARAGRGGYPRRCSCLWTCRWREPAASALIGTEGTVSC